MKPITLHPSSLFAGAALAALAFVAMAQQPLQEEPRPVVGIEAMVRAKDWFEIEQGVPFTVPPGKLLVLRSVGDTDFPTSVGQFEVLVDGNPVLQVHLGYGFDASGVSRIEVAKLLTVPAGAVVDLVPSYSGPYNPPTQTHARAWGYLVDA